jgi:hypothetical protein
MRLSHLMDTISSVSLPTNRYVALIAIQWYYQCPFFFCQAPFFPQDNSSF